VVLVGGAAADSALLLRAQAAGIPLRTTYAMTEASATLALTDLIQPERQGQNQPPPQPGLQLAGRPLAGVEIHAPHDHEISPLWVRSPGLLLRYADDPLPERPAGWWPTGDRGWLDPDTGQLWLAARHADLIVRGGENIDPLEVEQVLPPLPGVLEWAVIGRSDTQLGQQPVCVIVVASERPVWAGTDDFLVEMTDLPDVWQQALGLLAPFKRPVQFWLRTQPLPRTSLGKLQRAVLRGQWP
jgi:acyl-CoA synthetase (AMP-forming)/AMP-acid ligase II